MTVYSTKMNRIYEIVGKVLIDKDTNGTKYSINYKLNGSNEHYSLAVTEKVFDQYQVGQISTDLLTLQKPKGETI